MSLSLTSRARILTGGKHRSGVGIGIITNSTAVKVVCIQLPPSVVSVVNFSLSIEGVNRRPAKGTDSISGTMFHVNVLSCEVSAVVSSPS